MVPIFYAAADDEMDEVETHDIESPKRKNDEEEEAVEREHEEEVGEKKSNSKKEQSKKARSMRKDRTIGNLLSSWRSSDKEDAKRPYEQQLSIKTSFYLYT